MPFLENTADYAEDDQLTHTNLNALTESAKPVKAGSGVTNSGNTTDETSCNINSSGEIEVKDGGITTAKINDGAVINAKLAAASVGASNLGALSVNNAKLQPNSVAGSGTGATGANKIEAGSIGHADLNEDIITGLTELTAAPADEDEIMVSDGGTKKRIGWDTILEHPAFPRAYGTAAWDNPSGLTGDDYNVSMVSNQSTPTRIRVTMAVTMSGTDYTVLATYYNTASATAVPVEVYAKTATTFDLLLTGQSQASGLYIGFVVYGTLA